MTSALSTLKLVVAENDAELRSDQFLHQAGLGVSRRDIQRLIALNGVRAADSGGLVQQKGRRVRASESFILDPGVLDERSHEERHELAKKRHDVMLLRESDSWAALRKPAGLGSVARFWGDTLHFATYARELMADRRDDFRDVAIKDDGLVHRLDFGTSGVCVLARDERALQSLVAQDDGQMQRTYWAIIRGDIPDQGAIDLPIAHHPADAERMVVLEKCPGVMISHRGNAQPASTQFRVMDRHGDLALLEVFLRGGRRHQIRVHLAHIGFPILGDGLYGPEKGSRLALHAALVRFLCPDTGEVTNVAAEPGEHFWAFAPQLAREVE